MGNIVYTFLHSKRRLSESASLNVIRQLLLSPQSGRLSTTVGGLCNRHKALRFVNCLCYIQ
jgi:hypothetical protein